MMQTPLNMKLFPWFTKIADFLSKGILAFIGSLWLRFFWHALKQVHILLK